MIYTRYLAQFMGERTVIRVDRSLKPLRVPKYIKELTEEQAFDGNKSLSHKVKEMVPVDGEQLTLSVWAEN